MRDGGPIRRSSRTKGQQDPLFIPIKCPLHALGECNADSEYVHGASRQRYLPCEDTAAQTNESPDTRCIEIVRMGRPIFTTTTTSTTTITTRIIPVKDHISKCYINASIHIDVSVIFIELWEAADIPIKIRNGPIGHHSHATCDGIDVEKRRFPRSQTHQVGPHTSESDPTARTACNAEGTIEEIYWNIMENIETLQEGC